MNRWSTLLVVLLLATAASAQELPQPDSTPVALYGKAARNAKSAITGTGLEGIESAAAKKVLYCGAPAEILWREVARKTDDDGGKAVIYRQHLVGRNIDAELFGSEVGVYWLRDGTLMNVSGRQFHSVAVSGCAEISAGKAVDSARERVLLFKGQYEQHRGEPWTMDVERAARLSRTKLKLVQVDGVFRPAYFTVAPDGEGEPYTVVLDAMDERLLSIAEANPGSNCTPANTTQVTAWGIPVRPEITAWRSLKASPETRPGANYTHTGLWINTNPIRNVVLHGIQSTIWRCGAGASYTVHPLKVNPNLSASPIYDDYYNYPDYQFGFPPFMGRAAGDALWHTSRTMDIFKVLGRNGWDGSGGEARIVVDALGIDPDIGRWIFQTSSAAPLNSVALGAAQNFYHGAASLDHIAHEWGHGVLFDEVGFPTNSDVGLQMNEGWADVIGMIVEKRAQPAGTALEKSSDWTMEEDMATAVNNVPTSYSRGAIDDGTAGHRFQGPNGYRDIDDRLHRLDGTADPLNPHATGNLLNVAHLIMAAGGSTTLPSGKNPVCARLPGLPGCEASNAMTSSEYLGTSKAGSLLFYAIENRLLSNTTWTDVGNRVLEAAFKKFETCAVNGYNAWMEQLAVRKAFTGIGYPPPRTTDIQCGEVFN